MRPLRHADSAIIAAKQDYFNEFSQLLKSGLLVLGVLDVLSVLAVLGRARDRPALAAHYNGRFRIRDQVISTPPVTAMAS
jgi:hypothetical protein